MQVRSAFAINQDSYGTGLCLCFLRVSFALSLFLKHGVEKITGFEGMVPGCPLLQRLMSSQPSS